MVPRLSQRWEWRRPREIRCALASAGRLRRLFGRELEELRHWEKAEWKRPAARHLGAITRSVLWLRDDGQTAGRCFVPRWSHPSSLLTISRHHSGLLFSARLRGRSSDFPVESYAKINDVKSRIDQDKWIGLRTTLSSPSRLHQRLELILLN